MLVRQVCTHREQLPVCATSRNVHGIAGQGVAKIPKIRGGGGKEGGRGGSYAYVTRHNGYYMYLACRA